MSDDDEVENGLSFKSFGEVEEHAKRFADSLRQMETAVSRAFGVFKSYNFMSQEQSWKAFRVVQPSGVRGSTEYMDREALFVHISPVSLQDIMYFPGARLDEILVLNADVPKFLRVLSEKVLRDRVVEMTQAEFDSRNLEDRQREIAAQSARNAAEQPPIAEDLSRRERVGTVVSAIERNREVVREITEAQDTFRDVFDMGPEPEFRDDKSAPERRTREFKWYVDKVGHLLSRQEIREVVGVASRHVHQGTVFRDRPEMAIQDDGTIIRTSSLRRRLDRSSKRSEKFKATEEEVRMAVASLKHPDSLPELLVSSMVRNTDGYTQVVKNKISELTENYMEEQRALQRNIGLYQAGKFIQERLKVIRDETSKQANGSGKKKRAAIFHAYAKLFGGDSESYKRTYDELITKFMENDGYGGEVARIEKIIRSLIDVDKELLAQQSLLEASVSDRRALMLVKVNEQLSVIGSYDFVERLEMSGTVFSVYLGEVIVNFEKKLWRLGKYRVDLDLARAPREGRWIWIKGMDFEGNSQQHPHIIGEGSQICWGNIKEGIYKLYAEWNFPMLISLIWNFLHAYNVGDCYVSIDQLLKDINRSPVDMIQGHPVRS